jgi:hypothetical protein
MASLTENSLIFSNESKEPKEPKTPEKNTIELIYVIGTMIQKTKLMEIYITIVIIVNYLKKRQ